MNYTTFESFIHPDVLNAFLTKQPDITVLLEKDAHIGDEKIYVSNVARLNVGDQFVLGDTSYKILLINEIINELCIEPALLIDADEDSDITVKGLTNKNSLINFYEIGTNDYISFSQSLSMNGVPIRFDADVYILKRAFIAMYSWILQNKSFLRDLNLNGMEIPKSQIYDHFLALLNSEKDDLEQMRSEALDELKRKQQYEADGKSGNGFVRYTAPMRNMRTGRYFR